MARIAINTGSAPDDGTGDPLRTAFTSVNTMTTEIYADDFVTTARIADGAITNALMADDAIDSAEIADGAIDTVHIANDQVTHDKLEARYTTKGSIATYTGAVSVDWATATNFVMGSSLTGAIEFDFTNFKTGQVLTIHNLTGSQTITLDSDAATSETFNKVGGNDYDGSSTNVLIVECIDDDATAVFNYSILTYTSDTTP